MTTDKKPESVFPDYKVPAKYRPILAKIAKILTLAASGAGITILLQELLRNSAG